LSLELEVVARLIDEVNLRARTLLSHISPANLHLLGLVPALQVLADDMKNTYGLEVDFVDDGKPKQLDMALREVTFRAVRELLMNVVKHAATHRAEIYCEREGDQLNIIVSDQGVGFDSSQSQMRGRLSGFGLFAIRERVEYYGGTLRIDSRPSSGTVAHLSIPISDQMAEQTGV
jgi:signal transduction histidine kinase